MIAYLALMGDKVDNVPGIKSCGPKTAAKWINEIGGIDAIRAAAPTMKGKIGENLRAGLPFIDEAVALVTIKRDAVISGAETISRPCRRRNRRSKRFVPAGKFPAVRWTGLRRWPLWGWRRL